MPCERDLRLELCLACGMPRSCHVPLCRLAGRSNHDSHPHVCSDYLPSKPHDYHARRAWQDAARARGEAPECGRNVCTNKADPAWVNAGTPLLYCSTCARAINRYNILCTLEVSDAP